MKGLGASAGAAVGQALVVTHRALDVRYRVAPGDVDREAERLAKARAAARRQLEDIRERLGRDGHRDPASIFDAQLLMLDDPLLAGRSVELINAERINAEWAVHRAAEELAARLDEAADAYLRERKADVADVAGRLLRNLRSSRGQGLGPASPQQPRPDLSGGPADSVGVPVILIVDELSPSTVAQMDWSHVAGFVSDAGSWTYHTAILARSLRIPAVVGLTGASATIAPGTRVAIDGGSGEVLIDPTHADVAALEERMREIRARTAAIDEFRRLPAVTLDDVPITLEANIELPEEAADARSQGAQGIGLVRSEYLLPGGYREAGEEAQFEAYARILEAMAPARVTVRTFDGQEDRRERSRPGLRGLRLSLARPTEFRVQLRALLRAARRGRLRIMFPFVTTAEELREARRIAEAVAAELAAEGETPPAVPLGAMIEVPAAAMSSDLLAKEADFLAIGTNDLVQFALAVDRADERTSHLYDPMHPAILRLLRQTVRGARAQRRPVSVCGEMAADPALAVLLVGLGVTELSMRPEAIPLVTRVLRATSTGEARRLAARALRAAPATLQEYIVEPER
jgi:phosphotransferase system enzyme I (PtsI)